MRNVTLITDLGTRDYYNAVLKAKILHGSPNTQFIDISHHVAHHNILDAAFLCRSSYSHFPKGTIHVILVHAYYTFKSELLLYQHEGQFFIAPNNGILSLVFDTIDMQSVRAIEMDKQRYSLIAFDRISHIIACIKNDLILELGKAADHIDQRISLKPVTNKSEIRATIIHIDQYENVVTNVTREIFEKIGGGRQFELFYKNSDPLDRLSKNYSDVGFGDPVCYFNGAGYLEIAINSGKASSLLGLYKNETVQLYFQS